MKLTLARLEKVCRRPRGSRTIARYPACAGMHSQVSFPASVRPQKSLRDASLRASAVVTHAARCEASDGLQTQARTASWRLRLRPDIGTAGGPGFLALVDAGRGNLTPMVSAAALQLFTLSQS